MTQVHSGLDGVVAAATALSDVDGERGELTIAGYPLRELAPHATFEETTWLLWHGTLPDAAELAAFRRQLAEARPLAPATLAVIDACVGAGLDAMDTLRIAAGTISLCSTDPAAIVAQCPGIVAAGWRRRRGVPPVTPHADLGHAANYLYMLDGVVPDPERVRALETYLNTVVDHGLNASTFTARVVTSTGSDLVSAVVAALGALKGPLHGGAPGPALDMVFEIGEASRAEAILRAKVAGGEKLMGFGHRVYKVRDPRADVLGGRRRADVHAGRRHGALPAGPRESKPWRCASSRSTSRGGDCRPTSSSTPRSCCTGSASIPACSRRRSPSGGSAAGSPMPPNSGGPTASSGPSRNTSGRAGGGGRPIVRCRPAPPEHPPNGWDARRSCVGPGIE